MKRVIGIGGIFFRSEDPESLAAWYRERLGIPVNEDGYCDFAWRLAEDPERFGRTVWSLFPADTDYFGPGDVPFMVNYRVDDLETLLDALREEGVEIADDVESHDFGRFGWITDPEGRRIELWEPGDDSVLEEEPRDADPISEEENGVVRSSVRVPVSAAEAFRVFTEAFGSWWPAAYTWSGEALETIAIEGEVGGRCFERGPEGFECDWGRVLTWDPPRRVTFTWQISPTRVPEPDPSRASEVDVRFRDGDGGTTVELVHGGFEQHGEGAPGYRDAMGAEHGWPLILEKFAAACSSG